jgi:hypothetical protein
MSLASRASEGAAEIVHLANSQCPQRQRCTVNEPVPGRLNLGLLLLALPPDFVLCFLVVRSSRRLETRLQVGGELKQALWRSLQWIASSWGRTHSRTSRPSTSTLRECRCVPALSRRLCGRGQCLVRVAIDAPLASTSFVQHAVVAWVWSFVGDAMLRSVEFGRHWGGCHGRRQSPWLT